MSEKNNIPIVQVIVLLQDERVQLVLFSVLALVSGALMLLMPETLGTKLPDTMEEAANLGKRNKSS